MLLECLGIGLLVGSVGSSFTLFRSSSLNLPQTLAAAFRTLGLGVPDGDTLTLPRINKTIPYAWGTRLLISLPAGLSSKKVIDQARALSEALRSDLEVYWKSGLIIDIYNGEMAGNVPYSSVDRHDWKVPIGVNRRGETVFYDFSGSFPHLLIGGISGGGKSVLLRGLLTSLAIGPKPDLYLCDLKSGVELNLFRDLAITKGFASNLQSVLNLIEKTEAEMHRRYSILERSGAQKWQGNLCILVMDELADLKTRAGDPEGATKNRIKVGLTRISAKGRAAGVILVLCTQRPSADVVDGLIKTNIATSISFRTRDGIQSRVILDHDGAAALPDVPGRCIFQQAHDTVLQTFNLSYERAKELLASCERRAVTDESHTGKSEPVDNNLDELERPRVSNHLTNSAAARPRRQKKRMQNS
ncbi:hypothetical protein J31TS4_40510 [Paenibacillus sp. J31TS4]|uniref:FtsK/SpoIIIE domain-containing protein n=1 Tax=Paenibacillus sp. J31TS4 TaxID=2807195 RepID=UPI001B10B8E5|nr:FtsK/SpoIIIE domain-containing protein [Paenibacillus sp. J31TS4]GIP40771.1 hypothetical protein J31TS4_40510 [Paenibacillus sp. J31TS4]